jgi:hypothetical protein
MQLAVVLDQSGEEAPQLAALTCREGLEQGILGILDAGVEPLQGLSAGGRQPNQVAATISLVAGARDEAVRGFSSARRAGRGPAGRALASAPSAPGVHTEARA